MRKTRMKNEINTQEIGSDSETRNKTTAYIGNGKDRETQLNG